MFFSAHSQHCCFSLVFHADHFGQQVAISHLRRGDTWTNLDRLRPLCCNQVQTYYLYISVNMLIYPLVNQQFAIEHVHRNRGFTHKKKVIFHSYVSVPGGIYIYYRHYHTHQLAEHFFCTLFSLIVGAIHAML